MKTIICGGRYYKFTDADIRWLDDLHCTIPITEVVCGGASGADFDGLCWAKSRSIPVVEFPPRWGLFGASAGPIRNQQMADYADACIAFPGSNGTSDMVSRAIKKGLKIFTYADRPFNPLDHEQTK